MILDVQHEVDFVVAGVPCEVATDALRARSFVVPLLFRCVVAPPLYVLLFVEMTVGAPLLFHCVVVLPLYALILAVELLWKASYGQHVVVGNLVLLVFLPY